MDNAGSGVDRRSAHRAYLIRQEQFGYEYMLEAGPTGPPADISVMTAADLMLYAMLGEVRITDEGFDPDVAAAIEW